MEKYFEIIFVALVIFHCSVVINGVNLEGIVDYPDDGVNSQNVDEQLKLMEDEPETEIPTSDAPVTDGQTLYAKELSTDIVTDGTMEQVEDTMTEADVQSVTYFTSSSTYCNRFYLTCNSYSAMYYIKSLYSSTYRDRSWKFGCKKITHQALTSCYWTQANLLNEQFIGDCLTGYAMNAILGYTRHTLLKDRQYKIKCCKSTSITSSCQHVRYTSRYFHRTFYYTAPSSYIISGLYSHRDNNNSDRKWSAKICKYIC